jgi:hypothetical protein
VIGPHTLTLTATLTVSILDGAFDVATIQAHLADAIRDRQWLDSRELETALGLDYPALAHPDALRYTLQVRPTRPDLAHLFTLRMTR